MAGQTSGAQASPMALYSSQGSPVPEHYQAIFARSEAIVAFVSSGLAPHFVGVSNGFLRALGLERGLVVGRPITELLAPDDSVALVAAVNRCLATSRTVRTTIGVPGEASGRFVEFAVHAVRAPGFASHAVLAAGGCGQSCAPTDGNVTRLLDPLDAPGERSGGGNSAGGEHLDGAALLRAEEHERARIGRELHDSTSQYLVAADLGLARVLRSANLSNEERERLVGVQASLAAAQQEMRAFAYLLHPPELREHGLVGAVQRFCAGFARKSGLKIVVTATEIPPGVSADVEHAMFRVCQEALMNVYRHAFARHVSVALGVDEGRLRLEVRDDGIGVDGADRFEQGGMGVAGMRSRLLSVGGELSLDHLGPGLAVRAELTLPRRSRLPRGSARVVSLRS